MRNPTVFLVAVMLAAALASEASAQQLAGRIAVDDCYWVYWDDSNFYPACDVYAVDVASGHSYAVAHGGDPALSPDGTRVAFISYSLSTVNIESGSVRWLVDGASQPSWSADDRIAFGKLSSGAPELHVINADGTGLRQVTNGVGFRGSPSWSPDDRIAFECEIDPGNRDICSIRSDGTGFARLTNSVAREHAPAFSPDGTRIAFSRPETGYRIHILDSDGAVTDLNVRGDAPAWSPDGSRIAFSLPWSGACDPYGFCEYGDTYLVNVDGTGLTVLRSGGNPSWTLSTGSLPPAPSFTAKCVALDCPFDASGSRDDGSIVRYEWSFGDGTSGTGVTPVHTYAAAGTYNVKLTVTDDAGLSRSWWVTVRVVDFVTPIAKITGACTGLQCVFGGEGSFDPDGIPSYRWDLGDGVIRYGNQIDHRYAPGTYTVRLTVVDSMGVSGTASKEVTVSNAVPTVGSIWFACSGFTLACSFQSVNSSDADGTIVGYLWNFGDGTEGSGEWASHPYVTAGTYNVVLTVIDNYGGTARATATVPVVPARVYVASFAAAKSNLTVSWNAFVTVTVYSADGWPVSSATITGAWSSGSGWRSCTTDHNGVCTVAAYGLSNSTRSVTFTVQHIAAGKAIYDSALSSASSVTITRR